MSYRQRPSHFNPYNHHQGQYDTYYRSEKFKELIQLKKDRLSQVNLEKEVDHDDPNAFAYYKSSYDGQVKAILPYLMKPGPDDKNGKRKTIKNATADSD